MDVRVKFSDSRTSRFRDIRATDCASLARNSCSDPSSLQDDDIKIFETGNSLQFLILHFDVPFDAIWVVCHELCLFLR